MIKDIEGNKIEIMSSGAEHILCLGRSGSGKTYATMRLVEEFVRNEEKILVIDHSATFLEKFLIWDKSMVDIIKPNTKNFYYLVHLYDDDYFVSTLSAEMLKGFNIVATETKMCFRNLCQSMYKEFGYICISEMHEYVDECIRQEIIRNMGKITRKVRVLDKLRTKIDEFRCLNIRFTNIVQNEKIRELEDNEMSQNCIDKQRNYKNKIHLIQLDSYPTNVRYVLLDLILSLVYEEKQIGTGELYDRVILDEIQDLRVTRTSIIGKMLSKSRNHQIVIVAISQFLGAFDTIAQNLLLQASIKFIFKPTENDYVKLAKIIDPIEYKEWPRILDRLKIGECVLVSKYRVNSRTECDSAIKCIIN